MEIPPHLRPLDPTARKRPTTGNAAASGTTSRQSVKQDAVESSADRGSVDRYAALARTLANDPARLEELRRQIADGTFTATPEELAERLLGDGPAA